MLRSLGLGLGLETFAKFLRVSVSVSKNLVSVLENLVSEKSHGFGFGKLGLERKVSVSVSEKFGIVKKSRYRFRSNFWYGHSVIVGHSVPPLLLQNYFLLGLLITIVVGTLF